MIFKRLAPNDISITPFIAHKYYELNTSSSGVTFYHGQFYNGDLRALNISSSANTIDPAAIYQSLKSMFVNEYEDDKSQKLGQSSLYQERIMYENVQVISVPQKKFGEGLRKNTIDISIDLPNNNHLLNNTSFNYPEIINKINDPLLITSSSIWYSSLNSTASIANGKLYLSNLSIGSTPEIYQVIPSSSIITNDYMLTIDVNSLSNETVTSINVRIYQPGIQDTSFNINIDYYNSSLQRLIQLNSGNNAIIIIKYLNTVQNTIIYNRISIQGISERRILDDGYGNLYDYEYSQSSAQLKNTLDSIKIGEWNFRNGFQRKEQFLTGIQTRDDSIYKNHGWLNNVEFIDGLYSTKADFKYVGYKEIDKIVVLIKDENGNINELPISIKMNLPDSYVRIPHNSVNDLYNFKRNDDFSISAIIQLYNDNNVTPPQPVDIGELTFEVEVSDINIQFNGEIGSSITIDRYSFFTDSDAVDEDIIIFNGSPCTYKKTSSDGHRLIITGDINKITYISFNSLIKSMNINKASGLQELYYNINNTYNGQFYLPESGSQFKIFNSYYCKAPQTIMYPNTFATASTLNINLSECEYTYDALEEYLRIINYYTASIYSGSLLYINGNEGYTSQSLYYIDSLITNNWNVTI